MQLGTILCTVVEIKNDLNTQEKELGHECNFETMKATAGVMFTE